MPALMAAFFQAVLKLLNALCLYGNTQGHTTPDLIICSCLRLLLSSRTRSSCVIGKTLPSLFSVLPGSNRISPALKSTCLHWRVRISLLVLHPVRYANRTTG